MKFSVPRYSHATHIDVLFNDGPHIGQWFHKIKRYNII